MLIYIQRFLKDLFLFLNLCVCMSSCLCVYYGFAGRYQESSKKRMRSLLAWIRVGCELLFIGAMSRTCVQEKQQGICTA